MRQNWPRCPTRLRLRGASGGRAQARRPAEARGSRSTPRRCQWRCHRRRHPCRRPCCRRCCRRRRCRRAAGTAVRGGTTTAIASATGTETAAAAAAARRRRCRLPLRPDRRARGSSGGRGCRGGSVDTPSRVGSPDWRPRHVPVGDIGHHCNLGGVCCNIPRPWRWWGSLPGWCGYVQGRADRRPPPFPAPARCPGRRPRCRCRRRCGGRFRMALGQSHIRLGAAAACGGRDRPPLERPVEGSDGRAGGGDVGKAGEPRVPRGRCEEGGHSGVDGGGGRRRRGGRTEPGERHARGGEGGGCVAQRRHGGRRQRRGGRAARWVSE